MSVILTPEEYKQHLIERLAMAPSEMKELMRWILKRNGQDFRLINGAEAEQLLMAAFLKDEVTLKDWIEQAGLLKNNAARQGVIHSLRSVPQELWVDEVDQYYEAMDAEIKFAFVSLGISLKTKGLHKFVARIFQEPPLPVADGAHQGYACDLALKSMKKEVVERRCLELLPYQPSYAARTLRRIGSLESLEALKRLYPSMPEDDELSDTKQTVRVSIRKLEDKFGLTRSV